MAVIYHVTRGWDGEDLRSLARQVDDGDRDLDDALALIADKWCDGDLRKAEEYLDGDGHYVHCHATIGEASDYRDEWCEGGVILAIDVDGLDVGIGAEYHHPVVMDIIPAGFIGRAAAEV